MQNKSKYTYILKDLKRDWQLYLLLTLPVAFIIIFSYVPMYGLQIAFRDYKARHGIFRSEWVGATNFIKFFKNYYFVRTLKNTLVLSLYSLIFTFPIPIITALLLNVIPSKRFKTLTQTIITLPHFISVIILVGIMFQFFGSRSGFYGNLVLRLTGSYPSDLFSKPQNFRHFFIWSGVWQEFGWSSIIYLAALSSVSPTLHEAATVDGANRFKRVIHIDIPVILPTIVIMLILRTGSIMTIGFEKVFLMQNGVNLPVSEVISTYVYKVGLASGGNTDFSYATAIGLFNSVVNFTFIVTVNWITKKISDSSLW